MEIRKELTTGFQFWWKDIKKSKPKDGDAIEIKLTVIESYKHHALCQSKKGYKMSIANADLYLMGLVEPLIMPIEVGWDTRRIQEIHQKKLSS